LSLAISQHHCRVDLIEVKAAVVLPPAARLFSPPAALPSSWAAALFVALTRRPARTAVSRPAQALP